MEGARHDGLILAARLRDAKSRRMSRRQIWLGGWGVEPEVILAKLAPAFPTSEIIVLTPTRANLDAALASPAEVALGGWSLGARLILEAVMAETPGATGRSPITLVAPFLAFPSEAGQGGRASATQVKFLRRRLAKEPGAALADFYQRAGLDLPEPAGRPYPPDDLLEGLDTLADMAPLPVPADSTFRPAPGTVLLGGARDPLVDNTRLAELLPGLRILPDAGHDLADFVEEIAAVA